MPATPHNHTRLTHGDFLKIAVPFIVSTVTQPLLGAVDTAVIGHLGAAELIGGVAIGTVIMNTTNAGFFVLRPELPGADGATDAN